MIEFLKILLFAKTVLLTTSPIDIGPHPIDISFDESVSALTTGASIEIEISSMIDRKKYKTIREIRDYVDRRFSKGSISGRLLSSDNETILIYKGNVGIGDERVYLSLEPANQISLDREFTRLTVKSDVELNDVKILWRNYRK